MDLTKDGTMKEKTKIKGFNKILETIQKDPSKTGSFLKDNKKNIDKWFVAFFDKKTLIDAQALPFLVSPYKYYCRSWINEFLKFMDAYSASCPNFDKKTEMCANNNYSIECNEKFKKMLATLCHECKNSKKNCNSDIIRLVKNRCTKKDKPSFTKNTLKYISCMRFGSTDYKTMQEIYLKDLKNDTYYADGFKKKIKSGLQLLLISFHKTNIAKYEELAVDFKMLYEDFFGKKLYETNIRAYELIVVKLISIYYQFFWDLLNKMEFRNSPSLHEIISRSKKGENEKMILSFLIKRDFPDVDIESYINQIPDSDYDHHYIHKFSYLFNYEKISSNEFFKFSECIMKHLQFNKISILPEKELPDIIKTKINNYVKKRIFLRTYVKYEKNKESISKYSHKEKTMFNRYQDYLIFMSLCSFVYSYLKTDFRSSSKSNLDKNFLMKFCEIFKRHPSRTQKDIIEEILPGAVFNTINEKLNKLKTMHPNYKFRSKLKELIINSTDTENDKWIKIILESYSKNN